MEERNVDAIAERDSDVIPAVPGRTKHSRLIRRCISAFRSKTDSRNFCDEGSIHSDWESIRYASAVIESGRRFL